MENARPPRPIPPSVEMRCSDCYKLVINGKRTCWCRPIYAGMIITVGVAPIFGTVIYCLYNYFKN